LAELGGQKEDAPDRGDEPHEEERLRRDRVQAEGNLHGVQQLDDEEDQENPIEQGKHLRGSLAGKSRRAEPQERRDEKRDRACGEKQAEANVDEVLDPGEPAGDESPRPGRLREGRVVLRAGQNATLSCS
jgi:hypothetical protein